MIPRALMNICRLRRYDPLAEDTYRKVGTLIYVHMSSRNDVVNSLLLAANYSDITANDEYLLCERPQAERWGLFHSIYLHCALGYDHLRPEVMLLRSPPYG